jgi:SAM-dependent methyltransferase
MATNVTFETLNACPLCGTDHIRTLDASPHVCECVPCGYVFDNPRPTIEALVSFYSKPTQYNSWLSEEQARTRLWKRRLGSLLRVRKPGSLLDVGAGIGQFLSLARPYFAEVRGTEVSESAIEIAREKYGVDLIRGEIGKIDFGSAQFDNITVFHVLEHVPAPKSMVEKCALLLKKGGILVVAVPNELHSLRAITTRQFRKASNSGLPKIVLDGSLAEIHLSHFTPGVLEGLLKQRGFSVVRNTLDPYYVATGVRRWMHAAYYFSCYTLKTVLTVNLYDTILMVARKDRD